MASKIQREIKQKRPFVSPAQEATVALLRTTDLIRRAISAVVEPHGITLQQYNVLRILRGAGDEGLPTLEIAERMLEQTPGITRLIDRLEAKKLVTRQRSVTDRRQVFCRITKQGLSLLDGLDTPMKETESVALAQLSRTQMAQLVALLDQARAGLRAAVTARQKHQSKTTEETR